ncbi:Flp pilus assembly protein CpaB [Kocuria sediminis]|uniref:Flp pilus assembly protein CpaB n=1 Tax=Kocuria sediminis TaxID=1038857 RepID=A0A6N8GH12_9MICC|nr:SAF domain-containing protein [Kocuria sediminis]MUN61560.1 Flp pilus assembly protein CpaB [Kocuria sediminis]
MSPRPRPVRRRYPLSLHLRSALSRRRRLAAAVLVSLALGLVVLRLGPPRSGTVPVVTAAEALPAGTVLAPEQLAVAAYPRGLVPEGAVADPAELAGRTLAGAAGAGQPVTGSAVVGPGLLTGRPAGATAVTLRIDDPAVLQHVRAGDHVDVVGLSDGDLSDERRVLGRALPVLWVPSPASGADGGLLGASPGEDAGLLVVGAPHEDAARLAGAGPSTVVLVPAPVSPSAEAAAP